MREHCENCWFLEDGFGTCNLEDCSCHQSNNKKIIEESGLRCVKCSYLKMVGSCIPCRDCFKDKALSQQKEEFKKLVDNKNIQHSDFCEYIGKQFRKCCKCILNDILKTLEEL